MERINWKRDLYKILDGSIEVRYGGSFKSLILKNKILKDECIKCGIKDWLGEKISLELDHIDGNNKNNKLENIRLLCPNCHAITDNYKGKNRKDKKNLNNINEIKKGINFYKKDILNLYKEGNNIFQILKKLDLNIGGNYLMIYKILEKEGIEKPKKEEKYILKKEIDLNKTNEKLKLFEQQIEIIKNSNINFNERGWGIKVSKLLKMTPSASLKWIKRNIPEFADKCWQHSDNASVV